MIKTLIINSMLSNLVTWTCLRFHSFSKYIFSAFHISSSVLRAFGMFCVLSDVFSCINRDCFVARLVVLTLSTRVEKRVRSTKKEKAW